MELAFPPGAPPARPGPLSRFLPPVERGAVTRFLETHSLPQGWALDPFGTSPLLAIEVGRARGAVAAFSNPVTRFVLEQRLTPSDPADLGSALARLAAAPKDETRLELYLHDLYHSTCARCRASMVADHFIWDRELGRPMLKSYVCPACHHVGEDPTTPEDVARALDSPGFSLARALAAERAVPVEDPDREHVEAALAVYPPRALYALITLLQKIEQLDLTDGERRAAQALFLSAADAANGLWGYPDTRARPKQLIASARFREINVWRAFEQAREEWMFDPPEIELVRWPEAGPPSPGRLALFAGPIRDLEDTLPDEIPLVVTALPRPNQAYWTLSAVWASWLWGREAAAPIRIVLRRRRYDWMWHAAALRGAFRALLRRQPPGAAAVAFLPEAEPGFLAAGLSGMEAGGYRLRGHALRLADGQGVLTWESTRHRPATSDEPLEAAMRSAVRNALREQGEPASYGLLYAAAALDLAHGQRLGALWESEETPPLGLLTEAMESILSPGGGFERLDPRADLESGHYWLTDAAEAEEPLSDRVEKLVLEILRSQPRIGFTDLEVRVCGELRGLKTPDRRLVLACLASYAVQEDDGLWELREEDQAEVRASDIGQIRETLRSLGKKLGFRVSGEQFVTWGNATGLELHFRVQDTASLGGYLRGGPAREVVMLPGGRAALVAERLRRDPRLRVWLSGGGRIVKFRHIRRLASDPSLTAENLPDRLGIDPPEHEDPQLPLL